MKLCLDCLEELFDRDTECVKCKSINIICNDELEKITKELISSNNFKRKNLLKNSKYMSVNNYIEKKKNEPHLNLIKIQVEEKVTKPVQTASAKQPNIPKCPTCQSTDLKKITAMSKVGSVALWGVFAAGRTSKTWHCNNCGSEW